MVVGEADGGAVASIRGAGALDDGRTLRRVPENTRINLVGRHTVAFAPSALLLVVTVIALAGHGLDLGIDFPGGILLEARAHEPFDPAALPARLSGLGLGEVVLQEFGAPDDLLIRVLWRREGHRQLEPRGCRRPLGRVEGQVAYPPGLPAASLSPPPWRYREHGGAGERRRREAGGAGNGTGHGAEEGG